MFHEVAQKTWARVLSSEGVTGAGGSVSKIAHSRLVSWCWLLARGFGSSCCVDLSMGCLCLHGGVVASSTRSDLREGQGEAAMLFNDLALECIYLHFCSVLLSAQVNSIHGQKGLHKCITPNQELRLFSCHLGA